jgi:hypothetical protein
MKTSISIKTDLLREIRLPALRLWRRVSVASLLLLISVSAFSQSIPGLQFIRPDPNDGYPLLVQGVNTMDGETWEVPIQVYSDSNVELFTAKSYLIAAAHAFDSTGKYFVVLYSYYKNDYPCKGMFPPSVTKMPTFAKDCQQIGYRLRWLDVDTRAKLIKVTKSLCLDTNGSHLQSTPGDRDWTSITVLTGTARPLRVAIDDITTRLQREVQYEKQSGRF